MRSEIALPTSADFARDVIAELHSVDGKKIARLSARMKHFQRLGFPQGTNVGRGRSAVYDLSAIIALALAFELLELGLTPERAITLLRPEPQWRNVEGVMKAAWQRRANKKTTAVLALMPTALAELQRPERIVASREQACLIAAEASVNTVFDIVGTRRLAVIDARQLILDLAFAMARHSDVGLSGTDSPQGQSASPPIEAVASHFDDWASE